jgi:DNA primase
LDKDNIKEYLLNNTDKIEDILEYIECKEVKLIKNKRIQCALPDGDNNSSVQIFLDDYLSAKIYTRNEFEKYEIKDIYSVIQFIKECSLNESIDLVCKICNIKHTNRKKKSDKSNAYDFLKKYKRSIKKEEYIEDEIILDESFTERFVREDCELFLDDGVNSVTQEKFGVSYDVLDNRVVFPIRNDEGLLLSFKGRTCDKEYKTNGTPKFLSYYPCSNNNYLFGFYENYDYIIKSDELYIVEAEKGVMQLDSMNINNCTSVNKKTISDIQVKKILKIGKPVVLIFDKDVTLEEIFIECKKFKGLIPVYYIYDTLELLKEKESPTDKGIEIFTILLTECKFKYKGE